ncbi:MAG: phosphatidate cytidylyltransferase [Planctomycetaceae bacterium]|jgi:phosphatidate cytidylyltransferase|nr:phosphatidate cytidylyltransferase [Planctomycetaceae bacterium]
MNDPKTIVLLGGVLIVLTIASYVVWVLRKRRDVGIDAAVLDTFRSRIHAWWLLFGMLVGAFLFGRIATVLLFGLISFWALREYITLTPTRRADNTTLFWVFFLCTPLQFLLVAIDPAWFDQTFYVQPYYIFSVFVPTYVFLIIPAAIAISGDSQHFLERVAKIQVGLLICVYSFSYAPALLTLNFPTPEHQEPVGTVTSALEGGLGDNAVESAIKVAAQTVSPEHSGENNPLSETQTHNHQQTTEQPSQPSVTQEKNKPIPPLTGRPLRLLFFFVLIVQTGDVFQYLWSHIPRRHIIAPTINATRTWEGVLGGAATTSLLAAALWGVTPFPEWWQAAVAGLLISLMGFAGNLTMSAIKRDRGVEDYGTLIEGHNGVLDRIDSLCFAAPVFYHFVLFCLHTD